MAFNLEDVGKPLAERTDRSGNGRIRFTNVVFKNINGVPVSEAFVNQYLKIEFHFDINDPTIDPKKVIFACGLSDAYGVPVVTWVSDELSHNFDHFKEGVISIEIPNLNLRPQTYNLGIQLSEGTTSPNDFCDAVKTAAQLTILNDAVYTPGVNLKECRGYQALVPAKFD
jgi:lipopolysaccharide transport system ATP-binding protein